MTNERRVSPGPVAHDAQQVPGVGVVADEEAAPRVSGARVLAQLSPGTHLHYYHYQDCNHQFCSR